MNQHALRIDDALWRAALSRARSEGRTLTSVIEAGLRAYVSGEPGGDHQVPARARTVLAAPAREGDGSCRPARRRCTHPGTRVIGGFCRSCDALVEPGGYLRS